MGKKLALISGAVVVFVVVFMAFGGLALAYTPGLHSNVVASVHNLAADNVCEECHVPHFAGSTQYLWPTAPPAISSPTGSTSDIKPLCYSCHDGTQNPVGAHSAFDTTKDQHKTTSKTARLAAGQTGVNALGRDCDLCHDPHENSTERPNFIRYQRIGRTTILGMGPNVCVSCHTGNIEGGTDTHGHPTPQHNHPVYDYNSATPDSTAKLGVMFPPLNLSTFVEFNASTDTWGTRFFDPTVTNKPVTSTAATATVNCESCHGPHGVINDMLNTMSPSNGALCSNCHQ